MNESLEKVIIAVVGGVVGAFIIKKIMDSKDQRDEKKFDKRIARADEIIGNAKDSLNRVNSFYYDVSKEISSKVDSAIRQLYKEDSKENFKKQLDEFNFKDIAVQECKNSMRDITDSELSKLINSTYREQVHNVFEYEIRKYFDNNVKDFVKNSLDENYIQRMSRSYIKDQIVGILEDRADKALDDCDIDDIVEDYLKDRSIKLESIIRKTVTKLVAEKVDDLDLEVDDAPSGELHITFG